VHFENVKYTGFFIAMEISSKRRSCQKWTFDNSFWQRTIIQDFELVCEREYQRKWCQQVIFFGLLIGVVLSGIVSDR